MPPWPIMVGREGGPATGAWVRGSMRKSLGMGNLVFWLFICWVGGKPADVGVCWVAD